MLSSQEEQAERRRVLANDQRVKEQTGTFLSHTHMDEGGRFAQVSSAQIVGADPIPKYPAAAAHQRDPVGQEPALGYSVNDLDPGSPSQEFSAPVSEATSSDAHARADDVERDTRARTYRRLR